MPPSTIVVDKRRRFNHEATSCVYGDKISLFIVTKNCLGKQFTSKFLGTSSTNGSLKNVLCSKSILITMQ